MQALETARIPLRTLLQTLEQLVQRFGELHLEMEQRLRKHCILSCSEFQSSYMQQPPKQSVEISKLSSDTALLNFINLTRGKNSGKHMKVSRQIIEMLIQHTWDAIVAHAAPTIP